MMSVARRRILALLTATLAVGLFALPAGAAVTTFLFTGSDFYVPRPANASDQVGVLRLRTTFDLAANGYEDLIGTECSFEVDASNGDSVHPDNYAAVVTGGNETDVYFTEAEPNVTETVLEDETLVLGSTIELYNVMLPDPDDTIGTSVDFTVYVTCTTDETTTTTTEATTTTTEATTTTTEATTTTTAPTTTTSLVVTTTSSVLGTTTTTLPPVSPSTLPFTGSPADVAGLAMAATALLLLGGGALLASRSEK
jgi:hypothetical protein